MAARVARGMSALWPHLRPAKFQCCQHIHTSCGKTQRAQPTLNIFDRGAKKKQRERAASLPDVHLYDYIKEEVGFRLADRIFDVKRRFETAVDLGCGRGYVSRHVTDDAVGSLHMCDMSRGWLDQALGPNSTVPCEKLELDEEKMEPFANETVDLVISCLSLHWVNDLPGAFSEIHRCLKKDGAFLAAMFGGETLYELRCSLQLAEMEREGGFAPHISPFAHARDIGGLLQRTGFTLLTIDADEIVVSYPSAFELMHDLKGMGENNAAWNRKLRINRDTLMAAAAIYQHMYGDEKGVPATFQVFYLIGWKPDPSQPKPLPRGSGEVSLKDLHKIDDIVKDKGPKSD